MTPADDIRHVRIRVTGIVQGVGMRPFVYRQACAHGIAGSVLNAADGVHIDATGAAGDLDAFVDALRADAPAAARIDAVEVTEAAPADEPAPAGFSIVASDDSAQKTTLVSPDIATCDDCLRELFDPADRRYHYPFINCTNCGPRFTIIRDLPYDRAATSMDAFPMCPACAAEYADPADRRFHAQPDACFDCGPHLTWRERGGGQIAYGLTREASDAIIDRCADLLSGGGIVATKGLGGFHLACNAEDEAAVRELRRRKRRSNKPLAVMVRTVGQAERLCHVDEAEREMLGGSVRPIVLLWRRRDADGALAPSVAFDLPELGIMLPYTPLQHLLLAACADAGVGALVMTSGNISEEPIEVDDATAWEHLGDVADALLGNDRAILSRYDDSVVRVARGATLPVRRARGYAPRPLPLPQIEQGDAAPSCILACGPEQKATVALTREEADGTARCFVSQHIGDIESASTLDAWHDARMRLESLFGLAPAALACDAHPAYLSSQWARARAADSGLPLVEIQHHHAHIASVIAEAACAGSHDADEPVIGIAFDGTGAGDDGTVWGGEILVADLYGYRRAAHLRPWRLPGGAASVRDARRCAFALLAAGGLLDHPGARTLLSSLNEQECAITAAMVERGINSPLTSSMGRFLDACAALLGICLRATYEGEPAIELEAAASGAIGAVGEPPAFLLDTEGDALVIDPAPVVRRLLDGMAAGEDRAGLASLVHEAVARMAATVAARLARETGIRTVALSGGVFMNRFLLSRTAELLGHNGLHVLIPHEVPVNDGCIAYGQAAVARARLAQAGRAAAAPRTNPGA